MMDVRLAIFALLINFGTAKNLAAPEKFEEDEIPTVKIETDVRLTKFLLYTRENAEVADVLPHDATFLGHFDASRPTVIGMHGWNGKTDGGLADDILAKGDYNALFVDWGPLATFDNYFKAANNAFNVGDYAGEFVSSLITASGAAHDDIHIVGFSLGAQGAGHIARTVAAKTGTKVRRLTALEPAAPYINLMDSSIWVNKSDANFVDVLHTNSAPLFYGGVSMPAPRFGPLGHVDFYPNGGQHQPGCTDLGPIDTDLGIVDLILGGCSHNKGNNYFAESCHVDNPLFRATLCESWEAYEAGQCEGNAQLDFGIDNYGSVTEGMYFFNVSEDPPYALG